MKNTLTLFFFISLTFNSLSQDYLFIESDEVYNKCSHFETFKNRLELMQADDVERRPYDILTMDLFMDWTNPMSSPLETDEDRFYTGISKITLKIDSSNTQFIEFDAESFTFQNVLFRNISKNSDLKNKTSISINSNKLLQVPDDSLSVGDEIYIELHWTYTGTENAGFHIYKEGYFPSNVGNRDGAVSKRLAYTMSQPIEARKWMPCNDDPYEKQIASIAVKVPEQFVVASNGLLDSTESDNANITFYWSDSKPIPSYLMVANASEYYVWSEKVERRSDPSDSINLIYYVWESDLDTIGNTHGFKAFEAVKPIVGQMRAFEEYFTDYPWDQYGTVAIYPFWAGGMEHQTMESVNRSWLRGAPDGYAHELAHMWLGDMVTCASWADIWMNEGGASWGEAIWREWYQGKNAYDQQLATDRNRYLNRSGLNGPPIHGFNEINIFSRTEIIYNKAAWVYHMLRVQLGDEKFFELLRKYLNQFYFTSVSSRDMIELFKSEMGEEFDFDQYFDQWIYSAGHPVIALGIEAEELSNEIQYTFEVRQIQSDITDNEDVPEVFKTPIRIVFDYGDSLEYETIDIKNIFDSFIIYKDSEADTVYVDMTYTLAEVNEVLFTGVESNSVVDTKLYPNPTFNNISSLDLIVEIDSFYEIELLDLNGNKIKEIFNGRLASGSFRFDISCSDLSNGVYFVTINNGRTIQTEKLIIARD